MDSEIEELESLFSDHFGRTPLCTPSASQEDPQTANYEDGDDESVDEDIGAITVNERVQRYFDTLDILEEENQHEVSEASHFEDISGDSPDSDMQTIKHLKSSGCGCNLKCDEKFSSETIYNNILEIREMEKPVQEMRILKYIVNNLEKETTKRGKKRQRNTCKYFFNNKHVCKRFFMIVFDIGKRALENLLKHFFEFGAVPRTHGNTGRKPSKSLQFEEVKFAALYITNHAEEFGLPQPAAPRGRDDTPPIYLPSDTIKKSVHENYSRSCGEASVRAIGLSSFRKMWNNCLPHIKIASPRDDVCGKCEKIRKEIIDSVAEEEKLEAANKMRDHILLAQKERELYNTCVGKSRETHNNEDNRYTHYTFDFCQNVSLPHHSRQMGPLYFTTPRKVHIFGFRIDGIPKQLNFLIDENETIGKDGGLVHGPNAVISMVDWALHSYYNGEQTCALHADNCPGQNKNQFVMGYFMWRVMTGRHQTIEYMMQVPGHARCLVDAGFASLKQKYRRTDCDCMDQLEAVVRTSSTSNEAIRFPAWKWFDWKSFLGPVFRPIRGIREYQYFRFEASMPGVVTVRKGRDEEEVTVNILKTDGFVFNENDMPEEIQAPGLSPERQAYLYRTIRPFVRPAFQDVTCPRP